MALVLEVLSDFAYNLPSTRKLGVDMVRNLFGRATDQGLGASQLLCLDLLREGTRHKYI